MIIGNGLLASAFDAQWAEDYQVVLFASGVSNSNECRPEAFKREADLLIDQLDRASGKFVYFSTCSISDPDRGSSQYAKHKLEMERLVGNHGDHLILRLPQVVGRTPNPNTLTNFLAGRLKSGLEIPVWTQTLRCLVDVEHVAVITRLLVTKGTQRLTDEIAPPEVISMSQLIDLMEEVLNVKAIRTNIDKGGGVIPDSTLMASLAQDAGIDIRPGYTLRLLQKYYGRPLSNA